MRIGGLCALVVPLVLLSLSTVGWAQDTEELTVEGIKSELAKYEHYVISRAPQQCTIVADLTTPLLPSPTGDLLVRTMPSSLNPSTGKRQPYAWPTRNFPVWGSVAGGVAPYTYQWNFGDGSPTVGGAVINPNYIYAYHAYALGIWDAQLTVWDNAGGSVTATVPIEVRDVNQEIRKNAAIQDGLRYLYLHQCTEGHWEGWSLEGQEATNGAVIAEFSVAGHLPQNPAAQDIYSERVQLALDYVFANQLGKYPLPPGPADPDGNGFGIKVNSCNTYAHGIVMFGIASTRSPDEVATVGPDGVIGRTHREILTDMVDQLAYSQTDAPAAGRGGWRYSVCTDNYWDSDNSIVQWASIALAAAEAKPWSIPIPQFVKDELALWLAYSQSASGGFGYTWGEEWVNIAKTGSGIYSHFFLDLPDTSDIEQPVQNAVAHLYNHWFDWGGDGQFDGNFYAMYAVKKALEDYGISRVCTGISPLRACGGTSYDWRDHYEKHLIKDLLSPMNDGYHQTTDTGNPIEDGIWNVATSWVSGYGQYLPTAFALLTLTPGVTPCTPVAVMNITPPAACPGARICFDGSASYLAGTACDTVEVLLWEWDLDNDGQFDDASGQGFCLDDPELFFPLPGGELHHDYTVSLRVTSSEGKQGVGSKELRIGVDENHPPVAIPGGPYTACVGEPIHVNACDSNDPDSECTGDSIVEYCWDFEPDGTYDKCTDECIPDTFLVYNEEVVKFIRLRVRDTHGALSDEAEGLVEVWSSLREMWIHDNDITLQRDQSCDSLLICATVHAGTQEPGLVIDPTIVDFYYDDPRDPLKRIERFMTPAMRDGDAVTFCFKRELPDDGEHTIHVVVDPNQLIRECVETNNKAMKLWPGCQQPECHWELVRSWGYWKHQCRGNGYTEVSPDELSTYETEILQESAVFGECFTPYGCALLLSDPPRNNMRMKAAIQLYALWLNIVHFNLGVSCEISYPGLTTATTLGAAVDDIENVLCNPGSSKHELERVKNLAEALNLAGENGVMVAFEARAITTTPGAPLTIAAELTNIGTVPADFRVLAGSHWATSATPLLIEDAQPFVSYPVRLRVDVPGDAVGAKDELITITATTVGNPAAYEYGTLRAVVTQSDTKRKPEISTASPEPAKFQLFQNVPNPFNPSTTISFVLPGQVHAELCIYDTQGKLVRRLVDETRTAGVNTATWDGNDDRGTPVSSGIYFYRLRAGSEVLTKKMVLLK